jgi:2-isopropylmalate synthase
VSSAKHGGHDYIFDWTEVTPHAPFTDKKIELLDETLRDGIQSPSVTDPSIDEKLELIHLMESLGIAVADIGLPGAGQRAIDDVTAICQEMGRAKMQLRAMCAARTTVKDIKPILEVVQKTGVPIEVYAFIGSSPIRLFAEGWTVDTLLGHIKDSVQFSVKEGLEYCLVTEDTTRSRPDVLEPLFKNAVEMGVKRLCLCDTVGYVTPDGIKNLLDWTWALLEKIGADDVKVDWHGHNDRGMAVTNALFAIEYGADRVHGTGLGVGERVGNAALDQILLNLKLMGYWEQDLSSLVRYCQAVSKACHVDIPYNYPLAGRDAFRTATGVHAAAIIKAQKKGDDFLADRVYSGVPAGWFGRKQEIEIGHMSGLSNVVYWLEQHGIADDNGLAQAIFAHAKTQNRVLREDEVLALVRAHH